MTPQQALDYVGGKAVKLAAFLNVKAPVVHNWIARGRIPPAYQIELNALSDGALKLDRLKKVSRKRSNGHGT